MFQPLGTAQASAQSFLAQAQQHRPNFDMGIDDFAGLANVNTAGRRPTAPLL